MNIFPQTFQSLEQALSTSALKQRTHAANIANVDTTNYKSRQVNFQSALQNAMDSSGSLKSFKTAAGHIPFSTENSAGVPSVTVNTNTKFKTNGNNVDMDYEMAEMAKNQLWNNALTERINGKFNSLRSVISDGR
ncbi:flagellar basal body rod protein FlgB [Planococcus lenghuensis]|uniref:Flagellar basal body rod protein FlgB n=1 Tax=Planococcus lenghuensis TaxID=2213202 RepID=A0A1Q2L150_9BACL|nr:flagellar basal body rod protein FlgB [Planococcus lenghuensis]AQQ54136.1 flagellar basal body rod protein FlgB [Planococcus lenghuensis]